MRHLNHQLKRLCQRNRDGSFATQVDRQWLLSQMAEHLHGLGFRHMSAESLKPKHVAALVARWQREALAPGTVKNRLTALRWWAEKIGRPGVVARDNAHYGIAERTFVRRDSKAVTVSDEALARVRDEHVRMSLQLQRAFGLRREESIKFSPHVADQGERLVLKASWTKGGKAREIPIRTDAQRALLDKAHRLAGRGALIPAHRNYRTQLRVYERHTANAGLSKLHGLRHAYAQARYAELTGWAAPAAGGPSREALSSAQRGRDREARLVISRELGHEREQVTVVYLSR